MHAHAFQQPHALAAHSPLPEPDERGMTVRRSPPGDEATPSIEDELERLHERSFGWALSCCGFNRDDAADVLQATYLKVLDGRAKFGDRSLFSTWLFAVIRRTAAERRRRNTTRRLLLLHHAKEFEPTIPGEENLIPVDVRKLREALLALSPRQREVLHLVIYDEQTVREAAEIMGVGLGSARVHYDRAKKRLRQLLEKEYLEEIER